MVLDCSIKHEQFALTVDKVEGDEKMAFMLLSELWRIFKWIPTVLCAPYI